MINSFLGEKKVRNVDMLDGVTIIWSDTIKDELILDGNYIELAFQAAALVICHIKKFLDGCSDGGDGKNFQRLGFILKI
uniref:Uncharacterized protein n=1 Tax=Nelumbo nucifera TaxID=4432 RepID=A0A822Z3J3_NELNU|nr:TPA_asm: hypothetical protein HUJ06_013925 [Nelumbo nucifera]